MKPLTHPAVPAPNSQITPARPMRRARSIPALISENAQQIATSFVIVLASTAILIALGPKISQFWARAMLVMIDALDLTAHVGGQDTLAPYLAMALERPTPPNFLAHAGAALLTYIGASLLASPFRAFVKLAALLHLFFVATRAIIPGTFPYTIADHTQALALANITLLVALPTILAFTHAIIERSYSKQIAATVLITLYFVVSLPVKLVAHAVIIYAASPLIMPLMFVGCGPAFDVFIFTALYAYVVTWRHSHPTT